MSSPQDQPPAAEEPPPLLGVNPYEHLMLSVWSALNPDYLPPPTPDWEERVAVAVCQATNLTHTEWDGLDNCQRVPWLEQVLAVLAGQDDSSRRVPVERAAQPADSPPTVPPGEVLSDNEYQVLRGLRDKRPLLVLLADLSADTTIGRKACGEIVKSLIDRGLAVRPAPRKGVTITAAGEALLGAADHPPANDALTTP